MRGRRLRPFGHPSGLDHDHRLVPRRCTGRGHELARRGDRFEIEKDRVGLGIASEVIEDVAHVDIGAIAQRNELRSRREFYWHVLQLGDGRRRPTLVYSRVNG